MNGNTGTRSQSELQGRRMGRAGVRKDIAVNRSAGQEYLYRPQQLLVASEDLPLVKEEIDRSKPTRTEKLDDLGMVRFTMPAPVDIPALVTRLRATQAARIPRVGPNHVLTGEPFYQGGPAAAPTATGKTVGYKAGAGEGTRIAVIDTGFWKGHNAWLNARCSSTPADADALNVLPADGWLDDEAGHGTFIAGVVLQRAPSATVNLVKVLDSEGYGDEVVVARAIVRFAEADVLNLSLGGYSHGDVPPVALVQALRRVAAGSAVVAAAGNNSSDRVWWPAALKRVIAVGALDPAAAHRARFSNYGWWVDCAAPAVDVLSPFVTFKETAAATASRTPQTFKGWATWSGTSFAAPKVAGEIAALKTTHGLPSARAAAHQLLSAPAWLADLGVVLNL